EVVRARAHVALQCRADPQHEGEVDAHDRPVDRSRMHYSLTFLESLRADMATHWQATSSRSAGSSKSAPRATVPSRAYASRAPLNGSQSGCHYDQAGKQPLPTATWHLPLAMRSASMIGNRG